MVLLGVTSTALATSAAPADGAHSLRRHNIPHPDGLTRSPAHSTSGHGLQQDSWRSGAAAGAGRGAAGAGRYLS